MLVQSSVSLMFQLTDRKEANLQDLLYLYFTAGVASCSREWNVTAWMASQYLNSSARSYQFKTPKALFPKCFLLRSHLHALSQTTLITVGTSFRSSPGSTFKNHCSTSILFVDISSEAIIIFFLFPFLLQWLLWNWKLSILPFSFLSHLTSSKCSFFKRKYLSISTWRVTFYIHCRCSASVSVNNESLNTLSGEIASSSSVFFYRLTVIQLWYYVSTSEYLSWYVLFLDLGNFFLTIKFMPLLYCITGSQVQGKVFPLLSSLLCFSNQTSSVSDLESALCCFCFYKILCVLFECKCNMCFYFAFQLGVVFDYYRCSPKVH